MRWCICNGLTAVNRVPHNAQVAGGGVRPEHVAVVFPQPRRFAVMVDFVQVGFDRQVMCRGAIDCTLPTAPAVRPASLLQE